MICKNLIKIISLQTNVMIRVLSTYHNPTIIKPVFSNSKNLYENKVYSKYQLLKKTRPVSSFLSLSTFNQTPSVLERSKNFDENPYLKCGVENTRILNILENHKPHARSSSMTRRHFSTFKWGTIKAKRRPLLRYYASKNSFFQKLKKLFGIRKKEATPSVKCKIAEAQGGKPHFDCANIKTKKSARINKPLDACVVDQSALAKCETGIRNATKIAAANKPCVKRQTKKEVDVCANINIKEAAAKLCSSLGVNLPSSGDLAARQNDPRYKAERVCKSAGIELPPKFNNCSKRSQHSSSHYAKSPNKDDGAALSELNITISIPQISNSFKQIAFRNDVAKDFKEKLKSKAPPQTPNSIINKIREFTTKPKFIMKATSSAVPLKLEANEENIFKINSHPVVYDKSDIAGSSTKINCIKNAPKTTSKDYKIKITIRSKATLVDSKNLHVDGTKSETTMRKPNLQEIASLQMQKAISDSKIRKSKSEGVLKIVSNKSVPETKFKFERDTKESFEEATSAVEPQKLRSEDSKESIHIQERKEVFEAQRLGTKASKESIINHQKHQLANSETRESNKLEQQKKNVKLQANSENSKLVAEKFQKSAPDEPFHKAENAKRRKSVLAIENLAQRPSKENVNATTLESKKLQGRPAKNVTRNNKLVQDLSKHKISDGEKPTKSRSSILESKTREKATQNNKSETKLEKRDLEFSKPENTKASLADTNQKKKTKSVASARENMKAKEKLWNDAIEAEVKLKNSESSKAPSQENIENQNRIDVQKITKNITQNNMYGINNFLKQAPEAKVTSISAKLRKSYEAEMKANKLKHLASKEAQKNLKCKLFGNTISARSKTKLNDGIKVNAKSDIKQNESVSKIQKSVERPPHKSNKSEKKADMKQKRSVGPKLIEEPPPINTYGLKETKPAKKPDGIVENNSKMIEAKSTKSAPLINNHDLTKSPIDRITKKQSKKNINVFMKKSDSTIQTNLTQDSRTNMNKIIAKTPIQTKTKTSPKKEIKNLPKQNILGHKNVKPIEDALFHGATKTKAKSITSSKNNEKSDDYTPESSKTQSKIAPNHSKAETKSISKQSKNETHIQSQNHKLITTSKSDPHIKAVSSSYKKPTKTQFNKSAKKTYFELNETRKAKQNELCKTIDKTQRPEITDKINPAKSNQNLGKSIKKIVPSVVSTKSVPEIKKRKSKNVMFCRISEQPSSTKANQKSNETTKNLLGSKKNLDEVKSLKSIPRHENFIQNILNKPSNPNLREAFSAKQSKIKESLQENWKKSKDIQNLSLKKMQSLQEIKSNTAINIQSIEIIKKQIKDSLVKPKTGFDVAKKSIESPGRKVRATSSSEKLSIPTQRTTMAMTRRTLDQQSKIENEVMKENVNQGKSENVKENVMVAVSNERDAQIIEKCSNSADNESKIPPEAKATSTIDLTSMSMQTPKHQSESKPLQPTFIVADKTKKAPKTRRKSYEDEMGGSSFITNEIVPPVLIDRIKLYESRLGKQRLETMEWVSKQKKEIKTNKTKAENANKKKYHTSTALKPKTFSSNFSFKHESNPLMSNSLEESLNAFILQLKRQRKNYAIIQQQIRDPCVGHEKKDPLVEIEIQDPKRLSTKPQKDPKISYKIYDPLRRELLITAGRFAKRKGKKYNRGCVMDECIRQNTLKKLRNEKCRKEERTLAKCEEHCTKIEPKTAPREKSKTSSKHAKYECDPISRSSKCKTIKPSEDQCKKKKTPPCLCSSKANPGIVNKKKKQKVIGYSAPKPKPVTCLECDYAPPKPTDAPMPPPNCCQPWPKPSGCGCTVEKVSPCSGQILRPLKPEPLPPEELKIPDTQQSDADIDLKCDQKEIQRQATCLDKDFKPFKPKKETPKKKPAPLKLTHTEWDAVGINTPGNESICARGRASSVPIINKSSVPIVRKSSAPKDDTKLAPVEPQGGFSGGLKSLVSGIFKTLFPGSSEKKASTPISSEKRSASLPNISSLLTTGGGTNTNPSKRSFSVNCQSRKPPGKMNYSKSSDQAIDEACRRLQQCKKEKAELIKKSRDDKAELCAEMQKRQQAADQCKERSGQKDAAKIQEFLCAQLKKCEEEKICLEENRKKDIKIMCEALKQCETEQRKYCELYNDCEKAKCALEDELKQEKKKLVDALAELEKLRATVQDKEKNGGSQIEQLCKRIRDCEAKAKEISEKLKSCETDKEEISKKLQSCEDEKKKIEEKLKQLECEKNEISQKLTCCESERNSALEKLNTCECVLGRSEIKQREQVKSLQKELGQLENEMMKLRDDMRLCECQRDKCMEDLKKAKSKSDKVVVCGKPKPKPKC